MRRFRTSRRGDSGAAAVEFALLFPIFIILALGLINGGLAFSRQINVTQAAREASRFGATYDISQIDGAGNGTAGSGTFAQRASIWIAAETNALKQSAGDPNNPVGGYDYRCVALVTRAPGGAIDSAHTLYQEGDPADLHNDLSPVTNATTGCPKLLNPPSFPGTTVIQAVLSRNVSFFVVFINPTLHLDAVSNTPYEGKAA